MSILEKTEEKAIRKHFQSRSRGKLQKIGNELIVPLKYDESGDILTQETFDARKHLKRLNLNDWRFLECWRRHDWNIEKAKAELILEDKAVERLVRKLDVFRTEEARDRALAAIPSTSWVQARHVENVFEGGKLNDSERDSLKELAKIQGSYKNTAQTNVQVNFLQMPSLTPDQEKAAREFFDTIADQPEAANA